MLENQQDGFKSLTDEELVRIYLNGEQKAFTSLAVRYVLMIANRAAGLYSSHIEKDDLFQEGLLGLHNAVCHFDPDGSASFRTYASVCIRNKMLSAVRYSNSDKNKINNGTSSLDDVPDVPLPSDCEPENAVIIKESRILLENRIRKSLSQTENSVLQLYLSGLTYEQISHKLGISRKSCDNAMHRVRTKLAR